MRTQSVLFAGLLAACFAFAAIGCDKEAGKDYTCDELIDAMYEDGCELWCSFDDTYIYLNTCEWVGDGFEKSEAKDVCDLHDDAAEEVECDGEWQSLMNCAARNSDNCADDCEDQAGEFYDCMDW